MSFLKIKAIERIQQPEETEEKPKTFIGFYNYTVVLTYLGLASAVFGMFIAMRKNMAGSLICLMLAGLCDLFDGAVAKTRKRTLQERSFGIQIDSLCDVISFGVLPAVIAYNAGVNKGMGIFVLTFFVLAGVIRLAYYNVLEEERLRNDDHSPKCFRGLPITTVALTMPFVAICCISERFPLAQSFEVMLAFLAIAYLSNVPIRKVGRAGQALMILVGLLLFVGVLTLGGRIA